MKKILSLIISFALLSMLLVGCGVMPVNPEIQLVKTGYLKIAPNVSIGVAFERFFKDPLWKSFKTDSGERIVEFSGKSIYMDKEVTTKIQFKLNSSDGFEVGAVSMNDISQNMLLRAALLNKIFESDKKNIEAPPSSKTQSKGDEKNSESNTQKAADGAPLNHGDFYLCYMNLNEDNDLSALGKGNHTTKENQEGEVFDYGLTELTINKHNGILINLTTEDSSYPTVRGIRVGDPLSKIIAAYGDGYTKTASGKLELYEYLLDYQGMKFVLRFAVKQSDGLLSYIGMRNVTVTDAAY